MDEEILIDSVIKHPNGNLGKFGKEYMKKYRQEHKEDIRQYMKKYCQEHKEDLKKYRQDNKKNIYKRMKKYNQNIRNIVLENYGNKCSCCNETIKEFLAIDHIKGGGNKHRKEACPTGNSFYKWIIDNNFPKDLQILCHNCNLAKGFYGYCPHKKEKGK